MARIKNIELPNEKHTVIGLTAIYGIGRSLAATICESAGVEKSKKVKDLTNEEITSLRTEVDKDLTDDQVQDIRNAMEGYTVEGDLRREVQTNIKGKMEINSYQGTRHKKGLPVHGQRTSRNARTRKGKGKVVANKKKVGK